MREVASAPAAGQGDRLLWIDGTAIWIKPWRHVDARRKEG